MQCAVSIWSLNFCRNQDGASLHILLNLVYLSCPVRFFSSFSSIFDILNSEKLNNDRIYDLHFSSDNFLPLQNAPVVSFSPPKELFTNQKSICSLPSPPPSSLSLFLSCFNRSSRRVSGYIFWEKETKSLLSHFSCALKTWDTTIHQKALFNCKAYISDKARNTIKDSLLQCSFAKITFPLKPV